MAHISELQSNLFDVHDVHDVVFVCYVVVLDAAGYLCILTVVLWLSRLIVVVDDVVDEKKTRFKLSSTCPM